LLFSFEISLEIELKQMIKERDFRSKAVWNKPLKTGVRILPLLGRGWSVSKEARNK